MRVGHHTDSNDSVPRNHTIGLKNLREICSRLRTRHLPLSVEMIKKKKNRAMVMKYYFPLNNEKMTMLGRVYFKASVHFKGYFSGRLEVFLNSNFNARGRD